MKKNINKKNIKKFAGAALISTALVTGAGISYESSVNHDHEFCMLNYVFGLQHQVDKINNGINGFRYTAVYVPAGVDEKPLYDYNEQKWNLDVYGGYYGQHVVEYVSFGDFYPLENVYALSDGRLYENVIPYGERIELYDTNGDENCEPQLIRIFKK